MKKIKDLFESFVVIPAADGKVAVHMQGELVCGEAISGPHGSAYRLSCIAVGDREVRSYDGRARLH